MEKRKLSEILRYKFDNLMAKGTVALVGILFLATTAVVLLVGLIRMILGRGALGENVWTSVMHIIDAGTITAADTGDVNFVVLMSIVTLCGLFITSILIGIITTGFEEKLNSLKKGNSRVIENGHTLILGFNDNIYTIITELCTANKNKKRGVVVVLGDCDKEEMETSIAKHIPERFRTEVICRTGNISDVHMIKQCAIDTCKSVIINEQDDFLVTKAVLAINSHFSAVKIKRKRPHVVAAISDDANFEAVKIAGEGIVEPILTGDAISRIIAQTCRQTGLSRVLIEIINFSENELYLEKFPTLCGKTFAYALCCFENGTLFGYKRNGKIYLNPPPDTVIEQDDLLLIFEEDDGVAKPLSSPPDFDNLSELAVEYSEANSPKNLLVLGTNDKLERILTILDTFFSPGSIVQIADEQFDESYDELAQSLKNITLETIVCDINKRSNLDVLTDAQLTNVLLLSGQEGDAEHVDAVTLLRLIHLRDIAKKQGKTFNITSEMRNTTNQKLAEVAKVNDLVIGNNIINLILTQVSENRDLAIVFKELLSAEGAEIYLRPASNYLALGKPTDFYQVTKLLSERGEIAIGYKTRSGDNFSIITNPMKSQKIVFNEGDSIVLLATD